MRKSVSQQPTRSLNKIINKVLFISSNIVSIKNKLPLMVSGLHFLSQF